MKNNIILACLVLGFALTTACESYDFEQEQYKNEVGLLSNSQMIYDRQVADLSKDTDTIYLVAALSGTRPSDQDFKVTLMRGDSLIKAYNKSNFDIETNRYARLLSERYYTIPSLEAVIPAGQMQVKIPVYLRNLGEISPDSIYFLDYQIDPLNTDVFNLKKKEVLLRIYKSNEFSTTRRNVYYNYTSSFVTLLDLNNPLVRRPTSTNQVFPLAGNSVRMMAGDENLGEYKTALNRINERSIVVTIGKQTAKNPLAREVTITPYKSLDVVQLTPFEMYDNTFLINIISTPDGRRTYYKEFRLHYKYRLKSTDPYREVKAVLRMEYSPRAELL
ncbi:MAG: DUF4361 domain-containing protein [Bacteroidota bacterium]|jgi:hypothetical protein|nr:DUF4361 domain-containing protein [Bacteroidota bacterium]